MFTSKKLISIFIILIALLVAGFIPLQANEKEESMTTPMPYASMLFGGPGFTPAMQKMMQPNTWFQMMSNMMNPQQASPIDMCASCHEGQDIARFQQNFGPMMNAMWEPYKAMMSSYTSMNPAGFVMGMTPATQ